MSDWTGPGLGQREMLPRFTSAHSSWAMLPSAAPPARSTLWAVWPRAHQALVRGGELFRIWKAWNSSLIAWQGWCGSLNFIIKESMWTPCWDKAACGGKNKDKMNSFLCHSNRFWLDKHKQELEKSHPVASGGFRIHFVLNKWSLRGRGDKKTLVMVYEAQWRRASPRFGLNRTVRR